MAATFYNYASCYSNRRANSYTVLCRSVSREKVLFSRETGFVAVSPLSLSQLVLQQCSAWSMEIPEDRTLEMPEDLMREMCLHAALSASPSPSRSTSASPP